MKSKLIIEGDRVNVEITPENDFERNYFNILSNGWRSNIEIESGRWYINFHKGEMLKAINTIKKK